MNKNIYHQNYKNDQDVTFESGGIVYERVTIVDGFRWTGDLPKVIPPFSTPNSSGGVGFGMWVFQGLNNK